MNYVSMEDILIEEVRQRPSIYDKTTPVYKNGRFRDQEWKEVAKAINMSDVEAVKKRWRSLRDSFIKIQRSLKVNPKQVIKWVYYKRLMFLIPHIESKELLSDGVNKTDEDDDKNTQEQEIETDGSTDFRFVPDDVGFSDASTSSQNKTEMGQKRKKSYLDEDPLMTASQFYESCVKRRSLTSGGYDDDEQFLLSCLPALKRLPRKENAIARMKIQQVLFDVEFGHQGDVLVAKEEVLEEI